MYDLLNRARKEGLVALEVDIEDPAKTRFSQVSAFLKRPSHPRFRLRHHAHGGQRRRGTIDIDPNDGNSI